MGRERREGVKKKSFPYLINIPIAVYLICVLFGPMIWGIGLSFPDTRIVAKCRYSLADISHCWLK